MWWYLSMANRDDVVSDTGATSAWGNGLICRRFPFADNGTKGYQLPLPERGLDLEENHR